MSIRSTFRSMLWISRPIWVALIALAFVGLALAAPPAVQPHTVSGSIPHPALITSSSIFTVGVAPCSSLSIQACIDHSSVVTGDTIYVPAGVYGESVRIDTNRPIDPKWVSLIGAGRDTTILHAPAGGRVLEVQGAVITSAMVISGLTVAGGDLSGVASSCAQGPEGSCGAGILLWDQAQPLIQNVVISNNRALYGGGLYAAGGIHVTLHDVQVVSNSAGYGGGVLVVGDANLVAEVLTLSDTEFLSNTATSTPLGDGGGAQVGDLVDPETGLRTRGGVGVSNSRFAGNQAARRGAGLYVYGGLLRLTNSEFLGNRTTTVNGSGGGVYVATGAASVSNTVFERNTAGYGGGGVYVVPPAGTAMLLDGSRFAYNQGPNGGGLTIQGNLIMTATEFLSNTASLGGGIYEGGGRLRFTGGRFVNNNASAGMGGGVYGVANSTLDHVLSGTQFLGNAARMQGGGLHLRGSMQLVGVQFVGNVITGTNGRGGGLYSDDGAYAQQLYLTGTHFVANASTGEGGAAYFNGHYRSDVRIVNGLFARNQADGSGAVVAMNVDTNTASLNLTLLHATIADVTLNPKPAIAVLSGTLRLTNTIIASYSVGLSRTLGAAYEDYNLYFNVPTPASGTVTSGGHSFVGDPHFVNPLADDYHLGPGSVAIDAGYNHGVPIDFEGDPRDAMPDIGYDERLALAIAGLSATNDSPTVLGQLTTLTATVTSDDSIHFEWNFGDGQAIQAGEVVTHRYALSGTYTASVTASNSVNTVTATTFVTITNAAPVARAGSDRVVKVNSLVTLDGNGSFDPDGHWPLAWRWQQIGGQPVAISNNALSQTSFIAPSTPGLLTFTLTVTDSYGLSSAPDEVAVSVVAHQTYLPIVLSGASARRSNLTRRQP